MRAVRQGSYHFLFDSVYRDRCTCPFHRNCLLWDARIFVVQIPTAGNDFTPPWPLNSGVTLARGIRQELGDRVQRGRAAFRRRKMRKLRCDRTCDCYIEHEWNRNKYVSLVSIPKWLVSVRLPFQVCSTRNVSTPFCGLTPFRDTARGRQHQQLSGKITLLG